MPRPHVFVTRQIPPSGLSLLAHEEYEVDLYEKDAPIPREELLKRVKGCDAILSLLTDKIDDEVMECAGKKLKIIANYAVGFDNIDLQAAKQRGIIVTNTPAPEVSETVAEHTFALLLACAHRLIETDRYTREGKYHGWGPMMLLGVDVYGKTLGIIGAGRIGWAVAKRAVHGFGMRVVYTSRTRDEAFEQEFSAEFLGKEQLLMRSDFISIHLPLLPETRHYISTDEFSLMKKTAFLINTARGPIVDEKALERALRTSRIAGAGIDVYECEPLIDCDVTDHLELKSFSNVVLTPHTASATIEAREAMSMLAGKNIVAVLSGKDPINPARVS